MKKRILFLFPLCIGLIGLNHIYGVLTRYNAITAYIDKKNNIISIVEKSPTPAYKERGIIAHLLGFEYVVATDSNPSTPKTSGIRWYNKSMTNELERLKGKSIMKNWIRMSDSLFRINSYEKMKAAVLEIPEVKKYEKYLDSLTNGKEKPYVIVFVDVIEGNAHVGRLNKDSSVRILYNYTIDPYTLEYNQIEY